MGKVIAIILIVALGGLIAYEVISLVINLVKRIKEKKHKEIDDNNMEKDNEVK